MPIPLLDNGSLMRQHVEKIEGVYKIGEVIIRARNWFSDHTAGSEVVMCAIAMPDEHETGILMNTWIFCF